MGVTLGMSARVFFPHAGPEASIPLLIKDVMPIGLNVIVIAAYFSAIMSTADSCLAASSGNFVNNIVEIHFMKWAPKEKVIRLSQIATLIIGVLAVLLASHFEMVLQAILYAYSFMVSGLFIPTLGAYFWKKSSSTDAFWGMIAGGTITLILLIFSVKLPYDLDTTIIGIDLSAVVFITLLYIFPGPPPEEKNEEPVDKGKDEESVLEPMCLIRFLSNILPVLHINFIWIFSFESLMFLSLSAPLQVSCGLLLFSSG